MPPRIAIIGWGSLLWDHQPTFDDHHGEWRADGPFLPIEFSRVSKKRRGALTLVIDEEHGAMCRTSYALSRRTDPEEAIADLRRREEAPERYIGYLFTRGGRTCSPAVPDEVRTWAVEKAVDLVVWTGLPGNFGQEKGVTFSVSAAMEHLAGLSGAERDEARRYIDLAPDLVVTPLRSAIQANGFPRSTSAETDRRRAPP